MYVDGLLAESLPLVGVKETFLQKLMEYKGFGKTGQRMTVD